MVSPTITEAMRLLTSHRFRDIGYQHVPYFNCPNSPKCHGRCEAGKFTDGDMKILGEEDCRANWFEMAHMN